MIDEFSLAGVRHGQGGGLLLENHSIAAMLLEGAHVDPRSAVTVVAVDDPDEEGEGFRRISRIDLVVKSRNQYPAWRIVPIRRPSPRLRDEPI